MSQEQKTIKLNAVQNKVFQDFVKLDYKVEIHKRPQGYLLIQPELGLSVDGKSLDSLYKDLQARKEHYLQSMVAIGRQDDILLPKTKTLLSRLKQDLLVFALKTFLIGAILGVFILSAGTMVLNKAQSIPVASIVKHRVRQLVSSDALENAKFEKEVKFFRDALNVARPFIIAWQEYVHDLEKNEAALSDSMH